MSKLPNIHPGEILLEEFLKPMGISQNRLANAILVPPRRINEIVLGKRGITADTAIRLALALGTSEKFWTGLQDDYDLEEARRAKKKSSPRLPRSRHNTESANLRDNKLHGARHPRASRTTPGSG